MTTSQTATETSSPTFSRAPDGKSPTAFRTISEVANDLSVPQHVLRFWESKFQQIRPLKRGGGRRYYRPEDVQLISSIKDLLYNQGFTIRGVQKLLKENGRFPSARSMVPEPQIPASLSAQPNGGTQTVSLLAQRSGPAVAGLSSEKRQAVEKVLMELKSLRDLLRTSGI
ncbi:MAG: MerR family transcriptional regulator [Alphaproteobacteria bacterium]|nr:MerR family transcriptional regulator [Alphaproteobacteria bacterium]MBV8548028.1 MerR family transcriptional regulator [Alphaproteobacteria bacterium]